MGVIDEVEFLRTAMEFDRPEFNLDKYVSSVASPQDYDLRTKIEEWMEHGIVVFEGAVDTDLIDQLTDDIGQICSSPNDYDLEIEYRGGRYQLPEIDFDPLSDTGVKFNCLENVSLAARKLSLNHFVCSFLGHVFQDAPVALQSLTFWKGSNQPAHTDYPYVRTQTQISQLAASWIPLEDIHEDAGPLAYYPGSHQCGRIKPFDWGNGSVVSEPDSTRQPHELAPYLQEQITRESLEPTVFLPKKGDVLVWHGWVIHEGTAVRNPDLTRKSYVTHYTSMQAYPEAHKFPDAAESSRFTELNGGYVFDKPWLKSNRSLPSWTS